MTTTEWQLVALSGLPAERRAHARTRRRLVALRRAVRGFERAWRHLAAKYRDPGSLAEAADALASILRDSYGRRR